MCLFHFRRALWTARPQPPATHRWSISIGLFLAALLGAVAATRAQPAPLGSEIVAATCIGCSLEAPTLAADRNGGFLVAWSGPEGDDETSVIVRAFSADGAPAGPARGVSGDVAADSAEPAVAPDPAGGYLIAWRSAFGASSSILLQRLDAAGAPRGGPVAVTSAETPEALYSHALPTIAAEPAGGFTVAWVRAWRPGSPAPFTGPQIVARTFGADNLAQGPEIVVSQSPVDASSRPSVCRDTARRNIIAWSRLDRIRPFEANLRGIAARRLGVQLQSLGREFVLVAPNRAGGASVDVSCGRGNTFVVAWSIAGPGGSPSNVSFQRFTRLARAVGGVTEVENAGGEEDPWSRWSPAIAHDPRGGFVVTWEVDEGSSSAVRARLFSASGLPSGDSFLVAAMPSNPDPEGAAQPGVAVLASGNLAFSWREPDGTVVYTRGFATAP